MGTFPGLHKGMEDGEEVTPRRILSVTSDAIFFQTVLSLYPGLYLTYEWVIAKIDAAPTLPKHAFTGSAAVCNRAPKPARLS